MRRRGCPTSAIALRIACAVCGKPASTSVNPSDSCHSQQFVGGKWNVICHSPGWTSLTVCDAVRLRTAIFMGPVRFLLGFYQDTALIRMADSIDAARERV